MLVYIDNLIGAWQRVDNGSIYRFYKSGNLVIKHNERTEILKFAIESKNGFSYLRIGDRRKITFVNMTPKFFSVFTKSGIITLNKIVIQ